MTTTKKTATITIGYASVQNAISHYEANIEECNTELLKNSDINLGQFLFIRTETALANYAKKLGTIAKKLENPELTEAEKSELQAKVDEIEAEKAIIEPIHEALKADGFGENISPEVAVYAYGADNATTLHMNDIETLNNYATKIRNLGYNHYVHIKSLSNNSKKSYESDVYKEIKKTMQGMMNAMFPNKNYKINGEAVFAMCNILVTLKQNTDKNFGLKSSMRYAKTDSIIRQMCKIANTCINKRMESLEVKQAKEKVKAATAISEPAKDMENQNAEVAEVATAE